MKLSELAKHVNNFEKLSLFLRDEITKYMKKERIFLKVDFSEKVKRY